jgi:glutathione synthase/RimK-type ligase-like ATP-grasp enzyme
MKRCAFLTLDEPGDYVIDDEHAISPLADLGWTVSMVPWRQNDRPWSDFDAVVVRSTWDYWNDVSAFLDTLAEIDRQSRLANPLGLLQWNLRKTYLRDLRDRGVRIVPTVWLDRLVPSELPGHAGGFGADQLVIKPQIGANGDDAFRVSSSDDSQRLARIAGRFEKRPCMLQPFRSNVLVEGEFSLFYFNGRFSHAILKTPKAGEFRSQEERGARVSRIVPEPSLACCGSQAVAAITPGPLYARADFVRNEDGDFELMELELIEPSLYLRTAPGAPKRFAQAVSNWFRS